MRCISGSIEIMHVGRNASACISGHLIHKRTTVIRVFPEHLEEALRWGAEMGHWNLLFPVE